ncbi:hypothetical protein [Serratia fonticola]|uniref:hypothetical protein n=1 Tax=Serratia fonticola TaxID=47917 RepID=UPI0027E5FB5D|nr:hypothetical protein [Serratia fonticola]MDQ7209423.1 hypothetical protein [Serratia fonticola]HBE9082232.1 hypothetical protein [Serratia fonticola]HBE9092722.1 hypothetical protein [Serratia fonticola]
MRDIYFTLLANDFKAVGSEELQDIEHTYGAAACGVNSALRVIGNLLLEAEESENYSDSEAKRDLLLIGSVLRSLPRINQVLERNTNNAALELKKRQWTSQEVTPPEEG